MSSDHALLPADAQSSADAGATECQEHGLQRQLSGFALKFVGVAALLFSTYQLTVAAFAFFFQAEDGIRDRDVTGVQTCALPIWLGGFRAGPGLRYREPY